MSKEQKEVMASFKTGDKVFSVLTAEQLTVKKSIMPKGTNGTIAYLVTPKKGQEYRATEGELDWLSPYTPKPKRTWEDNQENAEE